MYSVVGFGLASFFIIAVYMFLNGQQHSQLPQCWLFEPDDDGTCDKVHSRLHYTSRMDHPRSLSLQKVVTANKCCVILLQCSLPPSFSGNLAQSVEH